MRYGLVVLSLLVGVAMFVVSDRKAVRAEVAAQGNTAVFSQLAYEHFIRLKVLQVTLIEKTDRLQLLKLKVQRFHGKIETKSLERSREHETQEFTILFPAAPDPSIKVGDLIDYQAVRYRAANPNS